MLLRSSGHSKVGKLVVRQRLILLMINVLGISKGLSIKGLAHVYIELCASMYIEGPYELDSSKQATPLKLSCHADHPVRHGPL